MMNKNINHAFQKTKQGNYFGYYFGYYIFTYRKPHGKWCCCIGRKGEWLASEGVFGTSLYNLQVAKKWAKDEIENIRAGKGTSMERALRKAQ